MARVNDEKERQGLTGQRQTGHVRKLQKRARQRMPETTDERHPKDARRRQTGRGRRETKYKQRMSGDDRKGIEGEDGKKRD